MNAQQQLAFTQLLAAWRRREDARAAGIHHLADARADLDRARADMRAVMHYR